MSTDLQATDSNGRKFSVLKFAGVQIGFPIREAVGVQRIGALEQSDIPGAIGIVVHAGRQWPVFQLSAEYQLSTETTDEQSYVVCLSADDGETGVALTCDTVSGLQLTDADLPVVPLPECMASTSTPVNALLVTDDRLVPISSAPRLAAHLRAGISSE